MAATVDARTEIDPLVDVSAWWRLWAMAAFAHVVSNGIAFPFALRSLTNACVGLLALVVVLDPSHRLARTAMVVAVPISFVAEAPLVGNHWLLAAAVSLGALAARPWAEDEGWWHRFLPVGRLLLLVFYSFAAFAKLNSDFLDPIASCSRFFANQMLSFWQVPEVSGGSWIASLLPYVTIAIELSVPLLLLLRPTRSFGVWLAIAFHMVLTLDLVQHFFDFTLVLIPLFLLFAPPGTLAAFDRRLPRPKLAGGKIWLGLAAVMVLSATLPAPVGMKAMALLAAWALWIGLGFLIVRHLILPGPRTSQAESLGLRSLSLPGVLLVGIMVFNGLTPYLELKTATGFNMYANLVTAGGETNHLVVPGTLELRSDQTSVATIVASSDEDLAEYVDSDFDLPLINLRDYLADHPDISVSFVVGDERVDLERAGDHPEWIEAQPWYVERLLPFRAVSTQRPVACQPSFLIAR